MWTGRLRMAGPLYLLFGLLRPTLLGCASLRVLNREVLAPTPLFSLELIQKVDILNLILDGEAEYRGGDDGHVQAKAGEKRYCSPLGRALTTRT